MAKIQKLKPSQKQVEDAIRTLMSWAGYDPDRHLVAVLYLFLRGMAGADTPAVDGSACGVFAWAPPGGLVRELSDVLDRGAA